MDYTTSAIRRQVYGKLFRSNFPSITYCAATLRNTEHYMWSHIWGSAGRLIMEEVKRRCTHEV